ncbi:MAG: pyridoxal-phosphate dependent enzyme [Proteobacteria bacterium]|nr:MAG: pyridoxal-phosphate dependent enzyme [Pseudomonadota bacterium]
MHGYGVMSREIVRELGNFQPTHVIVHTGVGAQAASACASFWLAWGELRPYFIMVEPERADCFFKSALAGEPVAVYGDLDTGMAGLACGEVSPAVWDILRQGTDHFSTVSDLFALDSMRVFANPEHGDPAIVLGETGAAGLALLMAARAYQPVWRNLGLRPDASVLLLGSEGDTDLEIYREVVGRNADEILS